jgi:Protein of unknown function (DUF3224)
MSAQHAQGIFELQSWQEDAYLELEDGGKLTRASVEQRFSGDLDGEGSVEWLMYYTEGGTARFVGLQRFSGRLGERSGSVVLETQGTFDGGRATGQWSVIPRSGTGELRGIVGRGEFAAPQGSRADVKLEYDFE